MTYTKDYTPKAYILGAYGAGNLGDDLLFEAASRRYKAAGLQPVCVGYGRPQIPGAADFIAISSFYDFISSSIARPMADDDGYSLCVRGPDDPQAAQHECQAALQSVVAIGGGGVFWSEQSAVMFTTMITQAKMRGFKTEVLSIGLNEVSRGEGLPYLVKLLHDVADYFSVRDQQSYDAALGIIGSSSKLLLEDDLVAQQKPSDLFKAKRKRKASKFTVGLNVRLIQSDAQREHICLSLANAAKQLATEVDFVYIPQVRHKLSIDEQCLVYAEWLRLYSGGLIQVAKLPKTTHDFLAIYQSLDMVVGGRFHTVVAGLLHGLPSAMFVSDVGLLDKYTALAKEKALPAINLNQHNWKVTADLVHLIRERLKAKIIK